MDKFFYKIVLLRILIIGLTFQRIRCDPGERAVLQLDDVIGKNYDCFETPQESGKPTDVSIQIEILNIRNVDAAEMSFIADIFLYQTWKDDRLIYPKKNKNIEKVSLHPEWRKHIWTPDVYFHNAIEGKVLDTVIPYVYLWLKNDTTVVFGARLSLEFSCDMTLHNFPHDTQTCDIIIKSLTHTLTEMNLHWHDKDSLSVGDFIILPQFEFQPPQTSVCNEEHMMGKHGKFACLRGIIHLTRRSGYYVINIYIPTILIVSMSMLTFWIPVDAVPARITLGVTSLLTIITKPAALPSVSYIVALNVWLSVCIGFVFCSLLEYAAVIAILCHQKRIELEKNTGSKSSHGHCLSDITSIFYYKLENINVLNIDRFCRIFFPIIFGFHCIIYYVFYTKINPD